MTTLKAIMNQEDNTEDIDSEDEEDLETRFKFDVAKEKKSFGQPVAWTDHSAFTDQDIEPNEEEEEEGVNKTLVTKTGVDIEPNAEDAEGCMYHTVLTHATQMGVMRGQRETVTEKAQQEQCGMEHKEGGWPKDVATDDEMHKTRYRDHIFSVNCGLILILFSN